MIMTVVALVAGVLMVVGVLMFFWLRPESMKLATLWAMLPISALASIASVVLCGVFVSKLIPISFDTVMPVLFTALLSVVNVSYLKRVIDSINFLRRCLARES